MHQAMKATPALRLLASRSVASASTIAPRFAQEAVRSFSDAPRATSSAGDLARMKGRHMLTLADYTGDEINSLLGLAMKIKDTRMNGILRQPLIGKTMSMIFQKRSTRTRVSTETGMALLGGHALFLSAEDIQLNAGGETAADTAAVLGRMNDMIFARVHEHDILVSMTRSAGVPVINGLSDTYHPLQILADYQTMIENLPKLKGLTLAWVGDGNNIIHSYLASAAKMGVNLRIATPKGYMPDASILERGRAEAEKYGTECAYFEDPVEACSGADVIATDTWISMGDESERADRLAAFSGYQVTMDMGRHANPDWKFMHCLPRKPEEVTDEVFYSPRSLVFPQAENRLWTVMAVMSALSGKAHNLL